MAGVVARAAVLDVGVSYPYATLSEAVAVAANGDVLVFHDALVDERVRVDGLRLVIRAASGATWQHVPTDAANNLHLSNGASVLLMGFDFVGDSTYGAVWVDGSTLDVRNSTFEGFNVAISAYGASPSLHVQRSHFRELDTAIDAMGDATAEIRDSTFLDNGLAGTTGAAAIFMNDSTSTLEVHRSLFASNVSRQFGTVSCKTCTIADSVFLHNSSDVPGSAVDAGGDAVLERNLVCGNDGGGAAVDVSGATAFLRNNAFLDNTASGYQAGALTASSGALELEHNTFAGNSSLLGPVVDLHQNTPVTLVGNLVAESATPDVAVAGFDAAAVTSSYSAWYANTGGDANFALGPNDLVGVDPMLSGAGATCSWERIRPLAGSPLIDGDPTLLDADGSPADIGATGGPSAR